MFGWPLWFALLTRGIVAGVWASYGGLSSVAWWRSQPGILFGNSAVLNPEVHHLALKQIGPERTLSGTGNPIFCMRGRRQWKGQTYVNRTSDPFHFNKEREPAEIEDGYTLTMSEALSAFKDACQKLGLRKEAVESMFLGNAHRLIDEILETKTEGSRFQIRRRSFPKVDPTVPKQLIG